MQALRDILDSYEFVEEGGYIALASCQWRGESTLSLETEVYAPPPIGLTRWLFDCQGVQDYVLRSEHKFSLNIHTSHVLLLPYCETSATVHIESRPSTPAVVFFDLWCECRNATDDWLDVFDDFNVEVLEKGFGCLVSAPLSLLARYELVLAKHEISFSRVNEITPRRIWIDGAWHPSTEPIYVLVSDDSFVVAEAITVTSIPTSVSGIPKNDVSRIAGEYG